MPLYKSKTRKVHKVDPKKSNLIKSFQSSRLGNPSKNQDLSIVKLPSKKQREELEQMEYLRNFSSAFFASSMLKNQELKSKQDMGLQTSNLNVGGSNSDSPQHPMMNLKVQDSNHSSESSFNNLAETKLQKNEGETPEQEYRQLSRHELIPQTSSNNLREAESVAEERSKTHPHSRD